MAELPLTRIRASVEKEAAIRAAVRGLKGVEGPNGYSRIVTEGDVAGLQAFLAIPQVSDPIYTIEKPVTLESVGRLIKQKAEAQAAGEGFLAAVFDGNGVASNYLDFTVWPEWSAAEFAGAMRPDAQSKGRGKLGIVANVDWTFQTLGVSRICFTAALDNVRSIKVIENLGGEYKGEIDSLKPDGTIRRSRAWEIPADGWGEAKARLLGGAA